MFNTLLRINRELEEAAYIVQRTQGSQAHYIKEIKKGIVNNMKAKVERLGGLRNSY